MKIKNYGLQQEKLKKKINQNIEYLIIYLKFKLE